MPIYEYRCRECGQHIEKRQKVTDEPLKTCEECGGALEKQWSLSGFQFKGAGWYITDYSKKSNGSDKPVGEKSSTSESTSGADSASKTKSESTTTSGPTKD